MKKFNPLKLFCKIGLHKKFTYVNCGIVNSIPMSCNITKCKRCNKPFYK